MKPVLGSSTDRKKENKSSRIIKVCRKRSAYHLWECVQNNPSFPRAVLSWSTFVIDTKASSCYLKTQKATKLLSPWWKIKLINKLKAKLNKELINIPSNSHYYFSLRLKRHHTTWLFLVKTWLQSIMHKYLNKVDDSRNAYKFAAHKHFTFAVHNYFSHEWADLVIWFVSDLGLSGLQCTGAGDTGAGRAYDIPRGKGWDLEQNLLHTSSPLRRLQLWTTEIGCVWHMSTVLLTEA